MNAGFKNAPAAAAGYQGLSGTRGVHHLALTCADMKRTTEFYVNVVGLPLVHAMKVPAGVGVGPLNRGNPPYERLRHYFFDMGNDSLLAFFEISPELEPKAKRDALGGMQHLALAVTPAQLDALMARLQAHKVDFSGPVDILPGLKSIYFYDPDGIRIEACMQPVAGEAPTVIASVLQTQAKATEELATMPDFDPTWVSAMTTDLPKA